MEVEGETARQRLIGYVCRSRLEDHEPKRAGRLAEVAVGGMSGTQAGVDRSSEEW